MSTVRTLPMLRALAASPGGLATSELARQCAADVKPRRRALTLCGNLMRAQEARGRVRLAGTCPAAYQNVPTFVWQITGAGRRFLGQLDGLPAGLTGTCMLVAGILGRPATATEIHAWLLRDGENLTAKQVYDALRHAALKEPPLMSPGPDGSWRLTEDGHALLREE